MKLTASGGESHAYSQAYAQIGSIVHPDGNFDTDHDDATLLPMHDSDVNKAIYDLYVPTERTMLDLAKAESYSNIAFACTEITNSFKTNPFIELFSEEYQWCWVGNVFSSMLNHAGGKAINAGKYSMTVAPNNAGTWGTSQNIPARLILNLIPVYTNPGGGVTKYREIVYYVQVKWGASYVLATWDQDNEVWSVVEYVRTNPAYSYVTNSYYTDPETDGTSLYIDLTSYENVTANGSIVGEVIVSATPTTVGISLPSVNHLHGIDHLLHNYYGTGSGSGGMAAYFSGTVTLVPQIKLKKP